MWARSRQTSPTRPSARRRRGASRPRSRWRSGRSRAPGVRRCRATATTRSASRPGCCRRRWRARTHEVVGGERIAIVARFRKFDTLAEAFDQHGKLIATNQVYARAMALTADPDAFADALTGVYATDPQYGYHAEMGDEELRLRPVRPVKGRDARGPRRSRRRRRGMLAAAAATSSPGWRWGDGAARRRPRLAVQPVAPRRTGAAGPGAGSAAAATAGDPGRRWRTATPIMAASRAAALTVYRMAENPDIMVLDFPSLHDQGQALNRVAAMVEKRGVPHDRVLDRRRAGRRRSTRRTPSRTRSTTATTTAVAAMRRRLRRRRPAARAAHARGGAVFRAAAAAGASAGADLASRSRMPGAGVDASMRETHLQARAVARRVFQQPGLCRVRTGQFWTGDADRGRARRLPPLPGGRGLRPGDPRPDDQRDAGLPDAHPRPAFLRPGGGRAGAGRGGSAARHLPA